MTEKKSKRAQRTKLQRASPHGICSSWKARFALSDRCLLFWLLLLFHRDRFGRTALHLACMSSLPIVRTLVAHGAWILHEDAVGHTLAHATAMGGKVDVAEVRQICINNWLITFHSKLRVIIANQVWDFFNWQFGYKKQTFKKPQLELYHLQKGYFTIFLSTSNMLTYPF
jgi:hypothetical protein